MRRRHAISAFIVLLIILFAVIIVSYMYYDFTQQQRAYDANATLLLGNWNLQIFGDSKASQSEKMNSIAEMISNFDVMFVQEIRDSDADSFYTLCSMLTDHSCHISSRAGRSPSKEQYGIIYLKNIFLDEVHDYNPDLIDRWERPPVRARFSLENYSFVAYNLHTKPNDTAAEIRYLYQVVLSDTPEGNIVVLGDLNADCSYYDAAGWNDFDDWHWLIKDGDDTTTSNSDCAYDRIIVNDNALDEVVDYGVLRETSSALSDHHPVYVRLRNTEHHKDYSMKAFIQYLAKFINNQG